MSKGNKSYLPQKPCEVCGRPMTWRKKWEKNWEQVKYCSDRCRKTQAQNQLQIRINAFRGTGLFLKLRHLGSNSIKKL